MFEIKPPLIVEIDDGTRKGNGSDESPPVLHRILFFSLLAAYLVFYSLLLAKILSLVDQNFNLKLICDLAVTVFSCMVLTLINWLLVKIPTAFSPNISFLLLSLPIFLANTVVFSFFKDSGEFHQIFAYWGLTLIISARLTHVPDNSTFLLEALIVQFQQCALDYYMGSESDLTKALWMLAGLIIGACVFALPYCDSKLAVNFLLVLVPQKYRPIVA